MPRALLFSRPHKLLFLAILFSYLCLHCPNPAHGQDTQSTTRGTISGQIVDDLSKIPVPLVRVTIGGTKLTILTGIDGQFEFANVSPGTYTLTAACDGYHKLI